MFLQTLTLGNFRRFQALEIEFHPSMTVIVARNGVGKSAVLDGVALALAPFLEAVGAQSVARIARRDAHVRRQKDSPEITRYYPVTVTASFGDPAVTVEQILPGPKSRGKIGHGQVPSVGTLALYGADLRRRADAGEAVSLPLIVRYGTNRLWKTRKSGPQSVYPGGRIAGYADGLASAVTFSRCQQWMAQATVAAGQEAGDRARWADGVAAVGAAVDTVLQPEGWAQFRYSAPYRGLVMTHPDTGTLPVSQMSDGVRSMVAMVADIAFRCVCLNGAAGRSAPQETTGIVVIDEVDLHLHPGWQQRILGALRQAFPRLQFVVSTHSPQVLSSVRAESIRLLTDHYDAEAGDWVTGVRQGFAETLGVASSEILAGVMGVDPIPPVPEAQDVARYSALIRQGLQEEEEGRDIRLRLLAHFGPQHPVLQECDRWIRLQAFKARRAPTRGEKAGGDG